MPLPAGAAAKMRALGAQSQGTPAHLRPTRHACRTAKNQRPAVRKRWFWKVAASSSPRSIAHSGPLRAFRNFSCLSQPPVHCPVQFDSFLALQGLEACWPRRCTKSVDPRAVPAPSSFLMPRSARIILEVFTGEACHPEQHSHTRAACFEVWRTLQADVPRSFYARRPVHMPRRASAWVVSPICLSAESVYCLSLLSPPPPHPGNPYSAVSRMSCHLSLFGRCGRTRRCRANLGRAPTEVRGIGDSPQAGMKERRPDLSCLEASDTL